MVLALQTLHLKALAGVFPQLSDLVDTGGQAPFACVQFMGKGAGGLGRVYIRCGCRR